MHATVLGIFFYCGDFDLCVLIYIYICIFSPSSNPQKLRDFIKHVYVDRRYTGEKSDEKLSRLRLVNPSKDRYGYIHNIYATLNFGQHLSGRNIENSEFNDLDHTN